MNDRENNVLFIPDIHGDHTALAKILDELKPELVCQLGDLVNVTISSIDDDLTTVTLWSEYEARLKVQIMGNHDASMFGITSFSGYFPAHRATARMFQALDPVYRHRTYGWFISHAGQAPGDPSNQAIGFLRGGLQPNGGVLWRDDREPLDEFKYPQLYGHTPTQLPNMHTREGQIHGLNIDTIRSGTVWCVEIAPDGDYTFHEIEVK